MSTEPENFADRAIRQASVNAEMQKLRNQVAEMAAKAGYKGVIILTDDVHVTWQAISCGPGMALDMLNRIRGIVLKQV